MVLRVPFLDLIKYTGSLKTLEEDSECATREGSTVGRLRFTVKTNGSLVEATQAAIVGMNMPGIMQKADNSTEDGGNVGGAVHEVSGQMQEIKIIVSPLVESLKIFADLVTSFPRQVAITPMHTPS